MKTKLLEIGDIVEQYNCTGSSVRSVINEYKIISVTKTLAKSESKRFKRVAEEWHDGHCYSVTHIDERKWSVLAYRLKE